MAVIRAAGGLRVRVQLLLCLALTGACTHDADSGTQHPSGPLAHQTVEVTGVWSDQEEADFRAVLAGFAAATGATVRYTSTGDDIAAVLSERVRTGNPPDVAMVPQPGLVRKLAAAGALKPLPPSASSAVTANYSAPWRDLGTIGGTLYAVYFKAANKSTMWYNPKVLGAAGLSEPPTTWAALLKDLDILSAHAGPGPLAVSGGDAWTLTDWFENVYLQTAGPRKYDALTRHEIPWTDPSVIHALEVLAQLWSRPGALKPGSSSRSFTQAVMMSDSPGAKALVTYLATPAAADIWAAKGGFLSPNRNVPASVYADATSAALIAQLTGAQPLHFDMSDQEPAIFGGTPGSGEWRDLQALLAQPSSVLRVAARLEADATAAFAGS